MKRKTVNKVLAAAFTTAFVCAAGGVATYNFDVQADVTTPTTLSEVSFDMLYGASMRVATVEKPNATTGLRFSAKMPVEHYSWLVGEYGEENVSFGTIIMPKSYATVEVDEDSLFGDKATYTWADKAEQIGTVTVLQMDGGIYEYTDDKTNETYMRVNGSIGPVKPGNYNREFFGVCYMAVNTGEKVEYFCATENDNERSLLYVAQAALDKEGWATDSVEYTTTKAFVDGYIASYEQANGVAPTVQYTVNKYYDDGTPTETNTYEAELGEKIELTKAEYLQDDFYEIDKTRSNMSGTAYTQDKLTLNVYYKKVTSFFTAGTYVSNLTDKGNGEWTFNPHYVPEEMPKDEKPGYIVVNLTPLYIADLIARDISSITVSFALPNGTLPGFEWVSTSSVGTIGGKYTPTWTLNLKDVMGRKTNINLYFFHHMGTSGNPAETIKMTVTEKSILTSPAGAASVTRVADKHWTLVPSDRYISLRISKEYVAQAVASGVENIIVRIANADASGKFGFDITSNELVKPANSVVATNVNGRGAAIVVPLAGISYSSDMAFRFFHHNGVSATQYCAALDIKVEEYTNDNVVSAVSQCVTNAMQENTWKIAGWAGTISFKISGEYLAQAVANGAKSITLSLVGINSDKAIGCQWKSLTFGTVPSGYPTTCTVALSASADYSAGLTVQIYHHNGANNSYIPEALKLTITQNK